MLIGVKLKKVVQYFQFSVFDVWLKVEGWVGCFTQSYCHKKMSKDKIDKDQLCTWHLGTKEVCFC